MDDAITDFLFSPLQYLIPSSLPAYLKSLAVQSWRDGGNRGNRCRENALTARPQDIHPQYEYGITNVQETCGRALLTLRARTELI
jgi:hypothetical protein